MTLAELRTIKIALERWHQAPQQWAEAWRLVEREIDLKTLDPRSSKEAADDIIKKVKDSGVGENSK